MWWWGVRFPVAALGAVCLALVLIAPSEGAQPRRAKIAWEHAERDDCSRKFSGISPMCLTIEPGEGASASASFVPTEDVVTPRLLLQSSNNPNVITVVPVAVLPDVLLAGERVDITVEVSGTSSVRAKNISARLYVADRQSVLSYPLNIRLEILHPTPEEIARTPVVVPTNHIQLVPRPPSALQIAESARFNVRHLVVTNGTNVTWTNRAPVFEPDTARAVKGTLCDPTRPLSPTRKCDFDPATAASCALIVDENLEQVITDAEDRILCFLSPKLRPQGHYALQVARPLTRQPLTYYMEDALHDDETMVEEIGVRKYYPYLTVK
jgi:hypothetical protein